MSCLRFAHMQRSKCFQLEGSFFRATCARGKSRKHGIRPGFDWAVPLDAGVYHGILCPAVQVMMELHAKSPDVSFCLPDLQMGPSGRLDSSCKWKSNAMRKAKSLDFTEGSVGCSWFAQ